MKLIVVTPYFYPKIGGLETYAYNISTLLKKEHNVEVVVITTNHTKKKYKVEKINGIKVYRLPYVCKVSNTPVNPLWFFSIKKIIKKENPDLINVHTPVPFIADVAAFVAGNIPVFVTYHAFTLYKYNSPLSNAVIKIYKFLEHLLFKKATKIILVSEVILSSIPKQYQHKVEIIHNSLSVKDTAKSAKRKNIEAASLIFIGNLDKSHEWKGLTELLQAIKIYKLQYSNNIHLSVIGDGDNKSTYQKLTSEYGISDNVTFLGKKIGKEKQDVISKATIGIVYPKSSNDAFPTVILEYWSKHVPVITSNISPINKLVKNRQSAFVVSPKNPNKLAKAIHTLVSDTRLALQIANGGYSKLMKNHLLENESRKFYQLAKGVTV